MWTPVSNLPLKRPINSMEKEESIYKISKGGCTESFKTNAIVSSTINNNSIFLKFFFAV